MSYALVYSTISAWVERHGFSLFNDPGRSIFLSSDEGECCQIWIDVPRADSVQIHAAAVEAKEDEEMRQDWDVPIANLELALENAVVAVRQWFRR